MGNDSADILLTELKDQHGVLVLDYPLQERVGKYNVWTNPLEGSGFDCVVSEWASGSGDIPTHWKVMECRALSDGIRHLWIGEGRDHENGYLNYPDPLELIEVFRFLDKLEREFTDKFK
jgi:hypothetical protein